MNTIETYKQFVYKLYDDKDQAHDFSHIERIISRKDELSDVLDIAYDHSNEFRLY